MHNNNNSSFTISTITTRMIWVIWSLKNLWIYLISKWIKRICSTQILSSQWSNRQFGPQLITIKIFALVLSNNPTEEFLVVHRLKQVLSSNSNSIISPIVNNLTSQHSRENQNYQISINQQEARILIKGLNKISTISNPDNPHRPLEGLIIPSLTNKQTFRNLSKHRTFMQTLNKQTLLNTPTLRRKKQRWQSS